MKQKALVVDDEQAIRLLVRTLLEKEGFEVSEAADATALRDLFSGEQPDVILLDLKLPDADGLELLPGIKKNWPTSEVIVLTGHATIDAAVNPARRIVTAECGNPRASIAKASHSRTPPAAASAKSGRMVCTRRSL